MVTLAKDGEEGRRERERERQRMATLQFTHPDTHAHFFRMPSPEGRNEGMERREGERQRERQRLFCRGFIYPGVGGKMSLDDKPFFCLFVFLQSGVTATNQLYVLAQRPPL